MIGAVLCPNRGAKLIDRSSQIGSERVLRFIAELGTLFSQVEDVNRSFAFSVDKGNLNVALMNAEGECDAAQQARDILRDNLQERRVCRRLGIKLQPGCDFDLGIRSVARMSLRKHVLNFEFL